MGQVYLLDSVSSITAFCVIETLIAQGTKGAIATLQLQSRIYLDEPLHEGDIEEKASKADRIALAIVMWMFQNRNITFKKEKE